MPDGHGNSLCQWIRRNRKELPVIFLTVRGDSNDIVSGFQNGADDFSKLQDEIYKTVTFLYQTRDAAVQEKNNFAENLFNIAHQIKTPITAISLSVQTMQKEYGKKQLFRLIHLEEALPNQP